MEGPGSCGGAARDANLVEDIADVSSDGFLADEQLFGNGPIRLAGRKQAQDLQLALAERAWGLMRGVSRSAQSGRGADRRSAA